MALGFTTAETIETGANKTYYGGLLATEFDNNTTVWDFDLELYYVYGFLKYFEAYPLISAGPEMVHSTVTNTEINYPSANYQMSSNTDKVQFYYAPIGIRVGGRIAGFAEVGYGYRGLVNLGLSVKWGAPCWWRYR